MTQVIQPVSCNIATETATPNLTGQTTASNSTNTLLPHQSECRSVHTWIIPAGLMQQFVQIEYEQVCHCGRLTSITAWWCTQSSRYTDAHSQLIAAACCTVAGQAPISSPAYPATSAQHVNHRNLNTHTRSRPTNTRLLLTLCQPHPHG